MYKASLLTVIHLIDVQFSNCLTFSPTNITL